MEELELDALDTRTRRFVIYEASRRRLPFDAIADAIAAGLSRETIEAMPREDFRALRGNWKPGTVVAVEFRSPASRCCRHREA